MRTRKIAVVGGGSWATAIVKMLSDNDREKTIYWWMRNKETVEYIRQYRHNPNYLSAVEIKLPAKQITDNLLQVIQESELIVLNVPAAFLKDAMHEVKSEDLKGKYIISAIKGIIPDENQLVGDYLQSAFGVPIEYIAVISGPCHAEEVSLEKLSYLTIASDSLDTATTFADLLDTRYIKTVLSDDIYGTEYGAVLKNIYAVASGICHGVGFGDNFQAVLISNAIREMARFLANVHPINRDINESAYLGDLLVTAYSQFSRNRTFGNMIGKGYTVRSAQLEMNMIAEGYYASKCIHQINKTYQVEMPICRAVYAILYEKHSPHIEMKLLAELLT
ncbi:NAD(P)H-dependent glycerol-3-phosphate dehydrogenase [Olivibacter sp. SDN3]|uniref:NAD(P)H-dependent glycerol-3-phosphate dehydrogenase n=1 Tax=Olivibacter sp. SDN3 TaxID=2764720 RepID=UPI0016514523|nr:NAD(P)H-dependent glycerol-3-phosphate dehydrogenase [Olivibacter sp. SDN3]QNL48331.1 NAD(P)H-dependent glycerol-3-phosphate dehydrogenase [Olivibacter sp. SDN3]